MRKVLIVEDDTSMQELIVNSLGAEYEVKSVADGNDAIGQANIFQPDVILLDVNLPGEMDGLGILDLIRSDEFTSTIPVLVYTNSDTDREEEFMSHGASGYFTKSVTNVATIASEIKKYADMPLAAREENVESV